MRIIDADGHVLEKQIPWADLLDAPYRSRAPKEVKDNRGFSFIMIEGKLTPKPVGKGCSFVGAARSHSLASTRNRPVSWSRAASSSAIAVRVFPGIGPSKAITVTVGSTGLCALALALPNPTKPATSAVTMSGSLRLSMPASVSVVCVEDTDARPVAS